MKVRGGRGIHVHETQHGYVLTADPVYIVQVIAGTGGTSLSGHLAAANPHSQYQLRSEKGNASGYAGLNGSGYVPHGQLGSGGGGSAKFLREDNTWQTAGTTDHAALASNLAWTTSGHTGTGPSLAGFDSSNAATTYTIPELVSDAIIAVGSTFFEDFLIDSTTTVVGAGRVLVEATGVNPGTDYDTTAADANHPGVVVTTTGTTGTGQCSNKIARENSILLGGGEVVYQQVLKIPTLSDATDRYHLLVGLYDTVTIAGVQNQVDSVAFVYDNGTVMTSSGGGGNWQCMTTSNSTRTFADSGTAVGTGWVNLKIVVNAAATSAKFYIDGTLVHTATTNIPSGAGRDTGAGWSLAKSAGTTARTVRVDCVAFRANVSR